MAGHHVTGWERAIAGQWDYDGPSHFRRKHIVPGPALIGPGLQLETAASRVYSVAASSGTGVAFPGRKPGCSIWRFWDVQSSEYPTRQH